jgi:hypothetical protein
LCFMKKNVFDLAINLYNSSHLLIYITADQRFACWYFSFEIWGFLEMIFLDYRTRILNVRLTQF